MHRSTTAASLLSQAINTRPPRTLRPGATPRPQLLVVHKRNEYPIFTPSTLPHRPTAHALLSTSSLIDWLELPMKEFLDELLVQIELLEGKVEGKAFRVTGFKFGLEATLGDVLTEYYRIFGAQQQITFYLERPEEPQEEEEVDEDPDSALIISDSDYSELD